MKFLFLQLGLISILSANDTNIQQAVKEYMSNIKPYVEKGEVLSNHLTTKYTEQECQNLAGIQQTSECKKELLNKLYTSSNDDPIRANYISFASDYYITDVQNALRTYSRKLIEISLINTIKEFKGKIFADVDPRITNDCSTSFIIPSKLLNNKDVKDLVKKSSLITVCPAQDSLGIKTQDNTYTFKSYTYDFETKLNKKIAQATADGAYLMSGKYKDFYINWITNQQK